MFTCDAYVGVDNRLMGWDPATLKEASKHKLDAKANTTCMAASCRGFVASGTPSLLVRSLCHTCGELLMTCPERIRYTRLTTSVRQIDLPLLLPCTFHRTAQVGTELGVLLNVHGPSGTMRLACNLSGHVPHGQKKTPKIYWVAVHPLQPQFVAVSLIVLCDI